MAANQKPVTARRTIIAVLAATFAVALWPSSVPPASADGAAGAVPALTETWSIARGGRLYDDWLAELEADTPKGSHPAYPAAGKMKGSVTWRCKECHGWDYRGRDGVYGQGQHYTGTKGVDGVRGMAPEDIRRIVRGAPHGFTEKQIPAAALDSLALFLSRGQIDMDAHISRDGATAKGDAGRGAPVFQTTCAVCHGQTGKDIRFTDEGRTEYLGTVCRENPWEALHKIRSGQPGVSMISLASLDLRRQVDVLAYCQTLPTR